VYKSNQSALCRVDYHLLRLPVVLQEHVGMMDYETQAVLLGFKRTFLENNNNV
jgi:hypothetical protein